MKKITFLLTAFLAFSLSLSAQKKTVQVLALNDMHAYLDRAAALGGVIDSLRAINPNLLVLSAGD
ncbi:MAG: bifunctional metallophosphatase/5'-nucleotidase, partial [Bacteroidales bacterium]|nr:bifunctional metallophosphatase/5'-nucleotidase [Bacteroidales bacterium]